MTKIATHSGGFHTDDVFAVATLQLVHGVENVEIIRTRDESIMATADIVVDVGGVYDTQTKRFDHHQNCGPVRENSIPYAAFGLVWLEYGEQVTKSKVVADEIERMLVIPVDAGDTGINLYELKNKDQAPFELYQIIRSFLPEWGSNTHLDSAFAEAVDFARGLLTRIILIKQADQKMKELINEVYINTSDKRVLVFDQVVSTTACIEYSEVMIVVRPDDPESNTNWMAKTVMKDYGSFEGRIKFPDEWLGLRTEDLARVTGISDAVFCHKAGFNFIAGSKEGVMAAVERVIG